MKARVFVILHVPALSNAWHVPSGVPLPAYPGTGDSVAVHIGFPLAPLTVKVRGFASDTEPELGETDALPQESDTVVLAAALLGSKSFSTVNVPSGGISVFVIVHSPTLSTAVHVPGGEPLAE